MTRWKTYKEAWKQLQLQIKWIILERKSVDDWVSACRGLVVEGTRGRGRSRKTWEQCVRDDMKLLGLHPEWAIFRDMWRDLIWGKRLTLAQRGKMDVFKINDDDDDDTKQMKIVYSIARHFWQIPDTGQSRRICSFRCWELPIRRLLRRLSSRATMRTQEMTTYCFYCCLPWKTFHKNSQKFTKVLNFEKCGSISKTY